MTGRFATIFALVLGCGTNLSAQTDARLDDPPRPFVPLRPATKAEKNRRASLHRYALGLLCERQDRLLDALKAFEESASLDVDAAAPLRAQIPLLIALDRPRQALEKARAALKIRSDDFETWYVVARLHRSLAEYKEAQAALEKAVACPGLVEHPEAAQQLHQDLARMLEIAGQHARAAQALRAAAKILDDPERLAQHGPFDLQAIRAKGAEVHERIGQLHAKAGQFPEAIEAFLLAQKMSPDGGRRLDLNLATVCKEQGRPAQALQHLDRYLLLQPLTLEPYELKIELLRQLKKDREILPWLEQAGARDRHHHGLKTLLARAYLRADKKAEAEKTFRELAELSPGAEAYRELFRLLRDDPARGMVQVLFQVNEALGEAAKVPPPGGAPARAKAMVAAFREDGELARNAVDVGFRLVDRDDSLRFETLHLLAILADSHRKNAEAEKFYRRCLTNVTPGIEALVYGGLLRTLWKARKYEEIVALCRSGLVKARATNRLLFHNDLAKALAQLKRSDEALREADRAIDLAGDQDRLSMRHLRVRILLMADRARDAEQECLKLLEEYKQPSDILEIRYLLSSVYSALHDHAKSEEQLKLILEMDPDNATANNDLGYQWADRGLHLEKAEAMIRKALELDRRQRRFLRKPTPEEDLDNAAYVDSLGWVLFRRGRFAEARTELERAVKLPGGDDPVLWDHLGDARFRLDDVAGATAAWQRALELFDQGARRHDEERVRDLRRKLQSAREAVRSR